MELLQWGANRRFETTSGNGGDYWQVCFGGIMHLFLNISGLVIAAIL
jgi:hypothetical protein